MSAPSLVHRLVAAQANRTPHATAVSWDGGSWSFREFDRRASVFAALLLELDVHPERLVAVSMEPSPLLLVAMVGIWKAGGVYVPIDASLPRAVAEGMVSDAGITLLIHSGPVAVDLPRVHTIDLADLDLSGTPPPLRQIAVDPSNLAYCVFTSGSTGNPKLVAVAHESFTNHALALRDELEIAPQDRCLQSTAMAFDAALEEILPAWLAGGTVVMPARRQLTSRELTELVERLSVTMVSLPSAYWHLWVDELVRGAVKLPPSLRVVFIGGDKILVEKLAAWYRVPGADRIMWVSDYGPTETSISVALHRPDRDGIGGEDGLGSALVSLGRPFASAALYVLDDELEPVPCGEAGDLWVGGPPVTRGYYGAPALTADRYGPDPQGPAGTRMYRTGDRAAYMPDGTLSFLGRSDRQVKLRGFRVELGHIESALHQVEGVIDAVAMVVDTAPGRSMLVAYVEGAPELTETGLRAALLDRLPESMMPGSIVIMDHIPRSRLNGKVARADLPAIIGARTSLADTAMTVLERAVAMVAGDVLGSPVTDRLESFFAAGGDSLQGMQILSRVAEVTGVALPFEELRSAPHVAGLSAAVIRHRADGAPPGEQAVLPRAADDEWQPTSHGQQALWYLEQVHRGAPLYSVPVCYRISGPLDLRRLDRALTSIVNRHASLRTVLVQRGGKLWQHIASRALVRTEIVSTCGFDDAAARVQAAAARPFDTASGPLLRSSAFAFGDEWLWLLNVHHAVFDAWSLAVFWRELRALYEGRTLPDVTVQFADYVVWQERWLVGAEAAAQRDYWSAVLNEAPPMPPVGARSGGSRPGAAGWALQLPPEAIDTAAVERVARECGSTPFVLLLAAFLVALARESGTDEPVVGVPVACRHRPGTEDIIGYFVNTVAVHVSLDPHMPRRDVVAAVGMTLAKALSNQDLPFADAVESAARSGRAGDNPVFQAMFAFQSTPLDNPDGIAGLNLAEHFVHSGTAKSAVTWTARHEPTGLVGEIEYAADAFDAASAARWQADLLGTVDAFLRDLDEPIGRLREPKSEQYGRC